MWGFADSCYLAVGINDQGVLVGKSWETHLQMHHLALAVEEIVGFNIAGVRDIAIGQVNDDSYTWKTEETLPRAGDYWTKGDLTGKLYLNMKDQNVEPLDVNNRICRKMRHESKNSRFKKLPLEEALALELPPELLEGFPSPFATEGPQVVSVPKASASASTSPSTSVTPTATTTTATVVDPLVGFWLRVRSANWPSPFCYAIVGQQSDGVLIGVGWEMPAEGTLGVTFWTPGFEYKTIPPRVLALQRKDDGVYAWETDDPGHYKGDAAEFKLPTNAGVLHLEITENSMSFSSGSKPLCRRERWGAGALLTYHKLSLEAAALLEFPVEVEQLLLSRTMPSPFELNTQWGSSVLIGQEVTGAAQTTGTTPDASDSDRR
jgi:hypothetical protein